jgi:hypothetical protein
MQNGREKLSIYTVNGKLQFSAANMTVLVQNQTTKKFGSFSALFDKSSKSLASDVLGTFCVLRPKFRPLGNMRIGGLAL